MAPKEPGLTRSSDPVAPRAAALLLHGGRQRSTRPPRADDLPVLRVELLRRDVEERLGEAGVATYVLRFTQRGWNGDGASAIRDARWALDHIVEREAAAGNGEVPVVVVGHSMGGRAAVHVADHPAVASVVGLAPWLPDGEAVHGFTGTRLEVAHGTWDRTTSPAASKRFVERAAHQAASATWTPIERSGHALLRRRGRWNDVVVDGVTAVLRD